MGIVTQILDTRMRVRSLLSELEIRIPFMKKDELDEAEKNVREIVNRLSKTPADSNGSSNGHGSSEATDVISTD